MSEEVKPLFNFLLFLDCFGGAPLRAVPGIDPFRPLWLYQYTNTEEHLSGLSLAPFVLFLLSLDCFYKKIEVVLGFWEAISLSIIS